MNDIVRMIIKNPTLKRNILSALADEEIVSILDSSVLESKSVNRIIKETDIPHTSAYRKVRWLLDNGLLVSERFIISPDGKKSSLFKSMFKSITVRYRPKDVIIEVENNVDVIEKTARRLFSLE